MQIPGTKISTQNSQVLTSSGFPAVDEFLGGGIVTGSISLFQADPSLIYADVLLKGFLSQGLSSEYHDICIVSAEKKPSDIIQNLFEPIITTCGISAPPTRKMSPLTTGKDEKMKIAWRYQSLPRLSEEENSSNNHTNNSSMIPLRRGISLKSKLGGGLSLQTEPFCSQFDITKLISQEALEKKKSQIAEISSSSLSDILMEIWRKSKSYPLDGSKYLRLTIHGLGSPFYSHDSVHEIVSFIKSLRSILSNCMASCMISLPKVTFTSTELSHIHHSCDYVLELQTLASTDKSYFAKEYTGIMTLIKTPRFHRLVPARSAINAQPIGVDKRFGFKCKRKKFVIELLCLPPELQEMPSRSMAAPTHLSSSSHSNPQSAPSSSISKVGNGCGASWNF